MRRYPNFQSKKAELAYEIAAHLYRLVMIGYFPLLICLLLIGELKPYVGFFDFGFGFELLMVLTVFGPIFLLLLVAGWLTRVILRRCLGTCERERAPLGRLKQAITATVITVTVIALLFVPFSTIHYADSADGGTVKTQALMYTVMAWDRTQTWDGEPIHEPNQRTRIYWFPHNFKSYDEFWDMKH